MPDMNVMDGNWAIAEAVRQVKPDVVIAHPILPAVPILERIIHFVSKGQMDTEIVNVESANSVSSACIGASAAGGRVFTASASQGLISMSENLNIASSYRLPMVLALVNRAISAPENINADHSDIMAEQSCGWIQIFSENSQEAYDNLLQAYKIAEHKDVRLPTMVGMDGYITSHVLENIIIEDIEEVNNFVGEYQPVNSLLQSNHPVTMGFHATSEDYFELKIAQLNGMEEANNVIKQIGRDFGDRFGRYYGFFESYKLDDADVALVVMGSAAGTAKEAVDQLRIQGEKPGLLKLRVFRPFPQQELKEVLSGLSAIGVCDQSLNPGEPGGELFKGVRNAIFDIENKPVVASYIYGLGGRNISVTHFIDIIKDLKKKMGKDYIFLKSQFIGLQK